MKQIQKLLGYNFNNLTLLEHALTHPSVGYEYNNQRLEFLGDRVLNLAVSELLYQHYHDDREGALSQRLGCLVNRETLMHIADQIGVAKYINLSCADMIGSGYQFALADSVEALTGAIYLDGGYGSAQDFVILYWKPLLLSFNNEEPPRDAKSLLQEEAQSQQLALPVYHCVERTGPDHLPQFKIQVCVDGFGTAEGEGRSKRAAQMQAAEHLLEKIVKNNA